MKLKSKLSLGFASVLLIVAVFFGISIYSIAQVNNRIEKNQQDRYQKIKYCKTIEDELNNISRYLRDLAFLDVDYNYYQKIESIHTSRKEIEIALNLLEDTAIRDETKNLLRQIKAENLVYIELQEKIIALATSGQEEKYEQAINDGAFERGQIFKYVEELDRLEDKSMNELLQSSSGVYNYALISFFISLLLTILVGTGITVWITRKVTRDIRYITDIMNRFPSIRDHVNLPRIDIRSNDEVGEIAASFNEMAGFLEEHARQEKEFISKIQDRDWLKTEVLEITTLCQGLQDMKTLANLIITKVTPMIQGSYGVFYVLERQGDKEFLKKQAVYAESSHDPAREIIPIGEGLAGQSALENRTIILDKVPEDYIKISSGLGETFPKMIIILPLTFKEQVLAVIELASHQSYTAIQLELLEFISKYIGTTINRVQNRMEIERLLGESQVLTEELQSQSEELQLQQEELKTFNENLEEQYSESEKRATELEALKEAFEEKARQLEESSNYKSEFLSNISHELRTPLNSLLILSQMLIENKEGNLTSNQIEYAKTIFSSGNELLILINDILDLSKIESGKITLHPEVVKLADMLDHVRQYFLPMASQKDLEFIVEMDKNLPMTICIDEHKLLQILKNLLSNAFKFTDKGRVSLRISNAAEHVVMNNGIGKDVEWVLAFSVIDTGIGMPKSKHEIVFEAFQQANGSTARKYGGTGLGLTISRKLAGILGGFIDIDSVEGQGSTFTLYLPGHPAQREVFIKPFSEVAATRFVDSDDSSAPGVKRVEDNSDSIYQADDAQQIENRNVSLEGKKILVVDDDMRNVFALTTALENHKIKAVFAENGREAIEVLYENPDTDLLLMDIMMPEMDGYEAIQRIRQIPEYANLPIIALTAKAMKNDREKCIDAGASDYISKPVNLEQLFTLIKIWLYR
ncbi:response regulator [Desulfosporosinus hippei]|uniref:Circadian input-output histidine kinase CikA n=1 Tax=Desulfosporosinus hippei DSM 8344 TaxID=1121419 RepID=A0A1G7SX75_9FIRM|nr:response regulator [Desulfosporosinus hippei]SDG27472.1 two-component system, chemotaxis family, sensor kinase CheA [Desulfosporosinus hippei DSM 8344]